MAWSLCGTIEECRVAAVEAVGSHHTHLGPVSEEYMVFKHSNSKGMWSLGPTIEDYFPGKQRHLGMTIKDNMDVSLFPVLERYSPR